MWKKISIISAFLVALSGFIPTVQEGIKSLKLGVSWGNSNVAENQLEGWKRNFDCSQNREFETIKNDYGIEVGSLVCPSGDILIISKSPDNKDKPIYHWVLLDSLMLNNQTSLVGLSSAIADNYSDNAWPASIICQRWVDNYHIKQRVQTSRGCFDYIIYAPTNMVVNSYPSQCNCYGF